MHRFGLQVPRALTEVGDGDAFGDFDHRFAHFLHGRANGATGLVRTGTYLVEVFTDATNRSESALDVTNNGRKRDFLRRLGEPIAAHDTAPALNDARGFEIVKNLFEETLGNVLLIGDGLNSDDALVVL